MDCQALLLIIVTNLDIHDISRSAKTFGFKNYFIITPLEQQQNLVNKILGHWGEGRSSDYNPDRSDALGSALVLSTIYDAVQLIRSETEEEPLIALTGANFSEYDGNTNDLAQKIKIDKKPCLLLFGTGWGLHAQVLERAHFALEPIFGISEDGYNHLSVRSAVAIYLDRIASASKTMK